MLIHAGWIERQSERAVCFRLPKNSFTNMSSWWFPKSRLSIIQEENAVNLSIWDGWAAGSDGSVNENVLAQIYSEAKDPSDEHGGNMIRMLENSGGFYLVEEPEFIPPKQEVVAEELICD